MKRTPTCNAMHVLLASPDKPTPEFRRRHQLTRMLEGLRALENDPDPKLDDWKVVSDAVNMMETFIVMEVVEDPDNLIEDAMDALREAGNRYNQGHPFRLSGKGIQACRGILQDYGDVIAQIPERTLVIAHRKTEQRIHDLLDGKALPHDVRFV